MLADHVLLHCISIGHRHALTLCALLRGIALPSGNGCVFELRGLRLRRGVERLFCAVGIFLGALFYLHRLQLHREALRLLAHHLFRFGIALRVAARLFAVAATGLTYANASAHRAAAPNARAARLLQWIALTAHELTSAG